MQTRKRLGDLLQTAGIVTEEQINQALENKTSNQKLGDALLERGLITERQLIEVLEFQLGIPHVQLFHYPIDKKVLSYVSKELAQRSYIMPLKMDGDSLVLAMNDPMDYYIIDDLEISTGWNIAPVIAARDDILFTINKYYDHGDGDFSASDAESSVIQVLDQLLQTGVQLKASDVHIDPQDAHITVRYRIDGRLQTEKMLPKSLQQPITARIKILADLNIMETRLPQDGRIKTTIGVAPVDLRISTLPTVYGEKVVIRILDLSSALMRLKELDFSKENYERYLQLINEPSGLILISGPTGSGKTSTLYASINYLNEEHVNVITIEDPVEIQLEGVNQVQVNSGIDFTFARGLRSILRQDPNIIMVGEIRDQETAEIAIRASLTGHLVFSTIHTNSAIDSIPRLFDMGIEPYLVVSSISGIVAQRLVRRICRDCRTERTPSALEHDVFDKHHVDVDTIYEGKGCNSCQQKGYRGRIAIQEVVVMNDAIREMLMDNRSVTEIRSQARKEGASFLVHDGLEKVKAGLTTMEEMLQVTIQV
ncbi:GspE/PulE family protein [Virgibacillus sp. W0181]|uniref:GspE/PulE family protein n=1 Tax=Virgibacillus sp. W0181 TaxID=3391581 RepID=UPI003F461B8A